MSKRTKMTSAWTLLEKIRHSIFESTNVPQERRNVQGWMPEEFKTSFQSIVSNPNKSDFMIIEVGSWKGMSALTMANACKERSKNCKIVCIDTWLGSPEHMEDEGVMQRINGIPTIFKEFCENVRAFQHHDVIYPFPISSVQGAHYLLSKNTEADIIYIDAGHEYESVLLDIKLYWKLLRKGGSMILDDWRWPGVHQAITEFFTNRDDAEVKIGTFQVVVQKTA